MPTQSRWEPNHRERPPFSRLIGGVGAAVARGLLGVAFGTALLGLLVPPDAFAAAATTELTYGIELPDLASGGSMERTKDGWVFRTSEGNGESRFISDEQIAGVSTTVLRDDPSDLLAVVTLPASDGSLRAFSITGALNAKERIFEGYVTTGTNDRSSAIRVRVPEGDVRPDVWPIVVGAIVLIIAICLVGRVIRGGCNLRECAAACDGAGGLRSCESNLCGDCSVHCNNDRPRD